MKTRVTSCKHVFPDFQYASTRTYEKSTRINTSGTSCQTIGWSQHQKQQIQLLPLGHIAVSAPKSLSQGGRLWIDDTAGVVAELRNIL